jgi:hypothetical protein
VSRAIVFRRAACTHSLTQVYMYIYIFYPLLAGPAGAPLQVVRSRPGQFTASGGMGRVSQSETHVSAIFMISLSTTSSIALCHYTQCVLILTARGLLVACKTLLKDVI